MHNAASHRSCYRNQSPSAEQRCIQKLNRSQLKSGSCRSHAPCRSKQVWYHRLGSHIRTSSFRIGWFPLTKLLSWVFFESVLFIHRDVDCVKWEISAGQRIGMITHGGYRNMRLVTHRLRKSIREECSQHYEAHSHSDESDDWFDSKSLKISAFITAPRATLNTDVGVAHDVFWAQLLSRLSK